jgi:hypothetical protein
MTKHEALQEVSGPEGRGGVFGRWLGQGTEGLGPDEVGPPVRRGEPIARGRCAETRPSGPLPQAAAFLVRTCSEASGRAWAARELADQSTNPREREALLRLEAAEEQRVGIAREALQEVWGITLGRGKSRRAEAAPFSAREGGR